MSTASFECIEHVILGQHIRHYFRATATEQEVELQFCVKQYKPRQLARSGDVTIIAAPGNGLPKEVYEPLWDHLLDSLRKENVRVRSIWIADYVNQGSSAELNKGKLGTDPSLFDHAKDYLALVNHFRREMPPPLVGIGHSAGTAVLANLATMHPRLLCSLSLIESNLCLTTHDPVMVGLGTIASREDLWSSEDVAIANLRQDPSYSRSHPHSLELFKIFGLTKAESTLFPKVPDGAVTLRNSKHQELFNVFRHHFSSGDEPLPKYSHSDVDEASRVRGAAFYMPAFPLIGATLPSLLPSCQFVYGRANHTFDAPPRVKNRQWRLQATGSGTGGSGGVDAAKVTEISIEGAGHCVPQEKPAELAAVISEWFGIQLRQWKDEQERQARPWSKVDRKDRDRMDDEWQHQVQKSVRIFKEKIAKVKARSAQKAKL